MTDIWLIGNQGMLGTELSLAFRDRGIPFIGTDREVDITSRTALDAFIRSLPRPPGWIINCAAWTAVDDAEDHPEGCARLNTQGPGNIAGAAAGIGARLLHISTDYVFDGEGIRDEKTGALRPYREDDPPRPAGVYGRTKLAGEEAVFDANAAFWIIRTAWLYGRYGKNFVDTMLRLMGERDTVRVVNDQRGAPTWTRDLAGAIITLVEAVEAGKTVPPGVYHYTGEGNITWFDFAGEIYRRGRALGLLRKDCLVAPCTTAEYPAKAKRPAWSVLDKGKIKRTLGITIPPWQTSLERFLIQK